MGPNGAHEAEIDPSPTTRQPSGLVLRDEMKQETGALGACAGGAGFVVVRRGTRIRDRA